MSHQSPTTKKEGNANGCHSSNNPSSSSSSFCLLVCAQCLLMVGSLRARLLTYVVAQRTPRSLSRPVSSLLFSCHQFFIFLSFVAVFSSASSCCVCVYVLSPIRTISSSSSWPSSPTLVCIIIVSSLLSSVCVVWC